MTMAENMRIWDAVSKTNPANTKTVNQRGGFTAINANSQIMEATRQFGPIGIGWGYIAGDPIFHETLLFVQVTLWHGDRTNTFGPVLGCEEWKDAKGRIDSDAGKKATTDAVTKLLSQLGFNADVFLGLYDDQKYVAELKREFADQERPGTPALETTKLMLAAIDACQTEMAIQAWLRDNEAAAKASPDRARIEAAFVARRAEIKQMDRTAA
jgi:hypothetical protein